MVRTSLIAGLLLAAATMSVTLTPASAGGLFGDGGLIRGDVGNFLDRNVEQPVLTPLARGTVEAVGTAVGGVVGGYVGGPTGAAVGGLGGRYVGQEINRCFAGQCAPIGRPAQYRAQAQAYPMMIGNWCATPAGNYPGPYNPVGSRCGANTPYGFFQGTVVLQ